MKNSSKTKRELLEEITALNQKIKEMEHPETTKNRPAENRWESERRFRSLVEATSDWLWEVNESGVYTFASAKAKYLLGYEPKEIIGKTPYDFMPKGEAQRIKAIFRNISNSRRPFSGLVNTNIHKDGRKIIIETNGVPLFDGYGNYRGYHGFGRDITRRKIVEKALKESESNFRALAENSTAMIFVIQGNKYVYLNPVFTAVTKYTLKDLVSMNFWDIISPDMKELVRKRGIARQKKERQEDIPTRYDVKFITKTGEERYGSLSSAFIEYQNKPAIIGTVLDITERKKMEVSLRASEEKYRSIFENAIEGIFQTTPDGQFISINPAFAKMLGYSSPVELIGDEINVITHVYANQKERVWFMELMDEKTEIQGLEFQALKKDKTRIWLSLNARAVKDAKGNTLFYEGTAEDITLLKQTSLAARENEERYRQLFDLESDAILLIDHESGRIIEANNAACNLYGYTRKELLAKKISNLSAEPRRTINAVKKELSHIPLRYHKKKNGTIFPTEITTTHLTWNKRKSHLAAIRDITKHKQAEEELERQRKHLRLVIDTVPNYIFAKDIEGKFLLANKALAELFGVDTDDVVGRTDLDYGATKEQTAVYKKADRAVIESGKPIFIPEEQVLRKDRSLGWFQTVKIPYRYFDSDKPAVLGVSVDITDRKNAEEEIIREREKLKILSDNAPFGMALTNRKEEFIYINAKFVEMFEYNLSDIPDRKTWFMHAFPDEEYRRQAFEAWAEDSKDIIPGERKSRVYTVKCKNGTQKNVGFIMSALASGDYLITCEDLTQVKKLELQLRQAQKMESIGTLAGGIAHDFNNILTALTGYASLMQVKMDSESPLRPYLDQIFKASQKAADLTRGLLTFSRQQPVDLVPLDINDTIKATEKLLRRLLTEDIELSTILAKDGAVIMADKSQMDQIFFNLVTNARDAMPAGGTLIIETDITDIDARFIRMHGYGKSGRYVRISISDTGEGMDEATREKIFDPFFTTKETGKGTGLGLATVYGIIKQNNGYITVDSEPGQGTTFNVYFPAINMKADQDRPGKVTVERGKETILIAEDNEEVRSFMMEALRENGYRIIEAVDGEDAIDKFRRHKPVDLIILDSVMPRMNGREACEAIRRMVPYAKVIFTSGYTKDIVIHKGVKDGDFHFIAKPLILDDFLVKVRHILDS